MAKVKAIITHPRRYLMVDGVLQRVPLGTEVELDTKQADRLEHQIADPKDKDKIVGGKLVSGGNNAAIAQMAAQIEALNAQLAEAKAKGAARK